MFSLYRSFVIGCCAKHNLRVGSKLGALGLLLWIPTASADWIGDARPMMGTEVSVYLWCDDPASGQVTVDEVFQEAARIDRLMSTYKDGSKISEINRNAAQTPVFAGAELVGLIGRALEISELTDGAFDITYDSVGQHYDFRQRKRPDDSTVQAEIDSIDHTLVSIDTEENSVRYLQDGVRINLGGIAKGYVVEQGVDILRKNGVLNGIVTAGGDSRLLGDRRGKPWMVGIRDPRKDGEVAIRVPLQDEAISTSGDYERYFEEDGVRYHHIIHPASGEPAAGVRSASVFGPDAVTTDALSTSVFVMGVDKGLRLIASLPDYESIVIDSDGRVFFSSGLAPPESDVPP